MPTTVAVALKPGLPSATLVNLARSVAAPSATFTLISLVAAGTGVDERSLMEAVRRQLDELATGLEAAGHTTATHVEFSSMAAGSRVVEIAGGVGADLLVVGLAKRSRVGKALLGSDAQVIILGASCPVLSTRSA